MESIAQLKEKITKLESERDIFILALNRISIGDEPESKEIAHIVLRIITKRVPA